MCISACEALVRLAEGRIVSGPLPPSCSTKSRAHPLRHSLISSVDAMHVPERPKLSDRVGTDQTGPAMIKARQDYQRTIEGANGTGKIWRSACMREKGRCATFDSTEPIYPFQSIASTAIALFARRHVTKDVQVILLCAWWTVI